MLEEFKKFVLRGNVVDLLGRDAAPRRVDGHTSTSVIDIKAA